MNEVNTKTGAEVLVLNNGISVEKIAGLIGAEICGSSSRLIRSFCSLDEPTNDGLSFTKSHRTEVESAIASKKLVALIVPENWKVEASEERICFLRVKDPLSAICLLTERFLSTARPTIGISRLADIHPGAKIGKDVHIGAFCSIADGVIIHDEVVLHPHVVLYENAEIGARSIIHSGAVIREDCVVGADNVIQNGAVIGAEGFGYFVDENKKLRAVPQVGRAVLKDLVDVGANSCVDRATLGTTEIGKMSKLDNLVQVGHNTKVGNASILCGHVGIAGSCKIGDRVTIGGCVGVADHITISNDCRVGGKSGVTHNLREPGDYLGFPAVPAQRFRRQIKALQFLPDMLKVFRKREKALSDDKQSN